MFFPKGQEVIFYIIDFISDKTCKQKWKEKFFKKIQFCDNIIFRETKLFLERSVYSWMINVIQNGI